MLGLADGQWRGMTGWELPRFPASPPGSVTRRLPGVAKGTHSPGGSVTRGPRGVGRASAGEMQQVCDRDRAGRSCIDEARRGECARGVRQETGIHQGFRGSDERHDPARRHVACVVIENRTAVAVKPRPELAPFFETLACQPDPKITPKRKRRA
ncbi:MAG: hypothetical protein KatS3mg059_0941 [Thermomicrobiales bacterium]|nr:MAG: hypothetical protein KatS3mg059_0941 [Thermomicrobiales bacterium]